MPTLALDSALRHAIELLRRASITPADGPENDGCQDYLEQQLAPLGFTRRRIDMGGVTNSIYRRRGEKPGLFAFAGHTDVVPTGPLERWPHPPFAAVVENGVLFGRGAQDMKGSIACWLAALETVIAAGTKLPSLQLLITSDEEGESIDGTIRLVEALQASGELPDAALVGEPSSFAQVGDTIRRGRRGVAQAVLTFPGKQAHSAYPEMGDNAIHRAAPILARIAAIDCGAPTPGFPPTTCQITNVSAGTGAMNVIPGSCRATLDIRYNPALDFAAIKAKVEAAVADNSVKIEMNHQANAFATPDGPFLDLVCASIRRVTGIDTNRDTGGGTSDGRFLAAVGIPTVELGPLNTTIHQVGERIALEELSQLTAIYIDILNHFEAPISRSDS